MSHGVRGDDARTGGRTTEWATPRRSSASSGFAIALAIIALIGLALRLTALEVSGPTTNDQLMGDAVYYHEAANLLADGKGYIDPYRYLYGGSETVTLADGTTMGVVTPKGHEEPTAGHPPLYVAYLAVFSAIGLDTIRWHQFASILLGTLSIVVAGLFGRSLRSPRLGLILAAIVALYVNLWISDLLVMSETAAVLFTLLTTAAGLRFWRSPSRRNAAFFGAVAALAALSRAELVLYLPVVVIVVLWRAPLPWRERLLRLVVAGGVALVVIAPWVIRNNIVMSERVTLSDGTGTVMVQANCDDTYYGDHIGYWSLRCGDPQPYGPNGELLDESQRDVVVRQRATTYISDHLGRLVTVVVPARIGRMWGVYEPFEQIRLDIAERRPRALSWLGFAQYVVLVPLAVAGAVLTWRRRGPALVIGFWVVMATFTAASAFGSTRYRIAAEVSVVVFAALALDAIWSWWRDPRVDGADPDDVAAAPLAETSA